MISVKKAETLVLSRAKSFGIEKVKLSDSLHRVLAEDVLADRSYPPFNRSTMDGIALNFDAYKKGIREFKISATIAAGQKPIEIKNNFECVKIMTGAPVPSSCDTVIPVEEIKIEGINAVITTTSVIKGQFIHVKGVDKKKGSAVLNTGTIITPEIVPVLASVGRSYVVVSKLPKVAIITTGNELVAIDKKPHEYQIRRSNDLAIEACLSLYKIHAQLLHIDDDKNEIKNVLKINLQKFDVVIISGGVSKGEFDYVYRVLEELNIEKIFHGIAQKPGKPMWFGKSKNGVVVFALPGNPVSSFLCVNRYIVPFFNKCLGSQKKRVLNAAVLVNDTASNPSLTLFTQATLETDKKGTLVATPLSHHGSGDFIGVAGADVFIELPPKEGNYTKGNVCKIWSIKGL